MKRLITMFLITTFAIPVYTNANESLRNSAMLEYKNASAIVESVDLEDPGMPITASINKAAQDIKPIQHIIFAGMTANRVKTIGIILQGLETMNSSNKAPVEYTQRINSFADDLVRYLNTMGESLEYGHYKQLFFSLVEVRSRAQSLKDSLKLIDGHENYAYWFGNDIEQAANELNLSMLTLKKSVPEIYSFIVPKLINQDLKEEWEAFVAVGISDLNRWEKLYMEKKLSYSGFTDLVDAKVSLKEMWEIYQESTLKNKSGNKFIKACVLKEIKDNSCVYKCAGGNTYTRTMERPLPNFENEPSNVICPQIVFPF
ncbi:MAG: hypothetical protein L6420_08830 [Elusimicrobia bacterium]|nr:hypothetical protein [Elusimicrobiota bacterium]